LEGTAGCLVSDTHRNTRVPSRSKAKLILGLSAARLRKERKIHEASVSPVAEVRIRAASEGKVDFRFSLALGVAVSWPGGGPWAGPPRDSLDGLGQSRDACAA
jgi:hypothetical protein